jgi:PE family
LSFVVTAPEMVTDAADNLAGIGSTLGQATAAAARPTTGIATAAADEVSVAISRLFGSYGQEFQALSAQAAAFHGEFVSLLNGSAAAYLGAELTNAQALPAQASAVAATGGAYQQLFANTNTNLQSLVNNWFANPVPFLHQIIANQRLYSQQIAALFNNFVQYFPQNLANLPSAIQTGIQGLVNFPFAYYTQQLITTQIAYTQAFFGYLNSSVAGIVAGLPAFGSGLQVAFQTALAGNYFGAVQQFGTALGNLLITGFDTSNYVVTVTPGFPVININAMAFPVPLGPLPEYFNAIGVLGQDAQYLTNLMPPGTIPRQISQNYTNVLNAISTPSIEAIATVAINITAPSAIGTLSGFFGIPVVLTYAAVGAPITTLDGLATTATSAQQALLNGNYLGALGAVVDAPAVVTNSFLNGQVIEDVPIPVPSMLPPAIAPPLPTEIIITLHLPFDGILVPPHFVTATVSSNSQIPIPGIPFDATIFGTPFMGLEPLLINYVPQQLALAITPPGS